MPTKWLQERAKGSKNGHGIPPHRAFCGQQTTQREVRRRGEARWLSFQDTVMECSTEGSSEDPYLLVFFCSLPTWHLLAKRSITNQLVCLCDRLAVDLSFGTERAEMMMVLTQQKRMMVLT